MADSTVVVQLKARCFTATKIGGVEVVLFVEKLDATGIELRITSPKKIQALRVYQELPGFDQPAPKPRLAGDAAGGAETHKGRAAG